MTSRMTSEVMEIYEIAYLTGSVKRFTAIKFDVSESTNLEIQLIKTEILQR